MAQKVLKRSELFILVIIGLIIVLFTMQKCGVNVVKTDEKTEMRDRPHG